MHSSRMIPIIPTKTAFLLVDVQNSEINPDYKEQYPWYFNQVTEHCLPKMRKIIDVVRPLGVEIIYTTIESLTKDGRDRSLDHKLSNIFVRKGSWEGRVIDAVAPDEDDICLKKTSSGVFNSTNIDYLLRNLGCEFLVVVGFLTDQCVDMAVRDGADKGYHVICIADACATRTQQRHENALMAFGGYCRIMSSDEFIDEIRSSSDQAMIPSCRLQNKSGKGDQAQLTEELKPMKLTMLVTTDLNGMTRGRSCPTAELENYLKHGCGWVPANSSLTPNDLISAENPWGCQGDLRLLPDRTSRVTLRHGPNPQFGSLDFIHCDIVETDGRCWSTCPRTFLREEIQRYEDLLGLRVYVSFEHEFTLTGRDSIDGLPAFSLRAQSHVSDFASWLMGALKSAGVEPEMFLPEFGHHQYEITCRPCFGVDAADRAVNVREITREIARQLGLHASYYQ